jgi:hypothetical protein
VLAYKRVPAQNKFTGDASTSHECTSILSQAIQSDKDREEESNMDYFQHIPDIWDTMTEKKPENGMDAKAHASDHKKPGETNSRYTEHRRRRRGKEEGENLKAPTEAFASILKGMLGSIYQEV